MVDIVLVPGGPPVTTTDPAVNVAPMRAGGVYVFTVAVRDDAGLTAVSKQFIVTVRLLT